MRHEPQRPRRCIRAGAARLGLVLLVALLGGCEGTSNKPTIREKHMAQKVTTFLMFEGEAEEAMNFYVSLFDDAKVVRIERYGPGEDGVEGSVKQAVFSIAGREFRCFDSSVEHGFTFTPAMSLFVTCESESEVDRLFAELSRDGQVAMPLDAYPFSPRFAWVVDRFGVSWQLYLPKE